MYGFHNITNSFRINGIVNEFTVPFGFHDPCPAEYGQMLGCDRLFQSEMNIQFSDSQFFMLIEDTYNLLPELMIQGTKNHRSLFQINKIYFYCSIIPGLSVEDHPIVTACAGHTVERLEGLKNIFVESASKPYTL